MASIASLGEFSTITIVLKKAQPKEPSSFSLLLARP